ncbi:MAG: AAA family ATPase, partial [Vicinamibacterales bacterium]
KTARRRGASDEEVAAVKPATDPAAGDQTSAVLLLDEIDKADPDVPNDLLEVLDIGRFKVEELDQPITVTADLSRVLLMITSNGERELPPAFLRRCVVLNLEDPNEDWLVTVANQRFGKKDAAFHREIARHVMDLRKLARERDLREPSTAEYLDAVDACRRLNISATSDTWKLVADALLWKREGSSRSQP